MIQDRIRQLVASFGLTTNSFATRIGSAQTNIHNIVAGRGSAPRWETYEKILDAFPEVSAEWLSRGTPPMFLDPEKQKAFEERGLVPDAGLSIGQMVVSKSLRPPTRAETTLEATQVRDALAKCHDEKSELERELRKSKDKIIELLERK